MRLAFDVETDGLLEQLTTIHSLVAVDIDTGQGRSFTDNFGYVSPLRYEVASIEAGLLMLMQADTVVGHNIIKFDIPAIQKVYPWFSLRRDQIMDTLLDSRLIWPDLRDHDFARRGKLKAKLESKARLYRVEEPDEWVREKLKERSPGQLIGSHGLEAWGYRLDEWKGDYSKEMKAKGLDPWALWNTAMQEYCEQDVVVTLKLFSLIESKGYSEQARLMERDFAVIMAEQERNGFPFHMERAQKLQHKLMRRHSEICAELKEVFKPLIDRSEFTPKVNNAKLGYVKGVTVYREKLVEFNPSSRQHIARWLKELHGWTPKEFTDTGQPKIDEAVLRKLKYPEAKLLSEYFLLDKRLGMLENQQGKGLIPFARQDSDGVWRIHGGVNTIGAVTRRCTHSQPNMAQLPANNVPFGVDFRSLMYAPRGWRLVGWDASGLELRALAHYMARYDGGVYTNIILDGDIHWVHAQALGLVGELEEYDPHDPHHDYARNKVAKRFISMG